MILPLFQTIYVTFAYTEFQMLKYIGPDRKMLSSSGYDNQVVTKILIKETEVHHSGTYQCEPGASPSAKVNVHVLDGK